MEKKQNGTFGLQWPLSPQPRRPPLPCLPPRFAWGWKSRDSCLADTVFTGLWFICFDWSARQGFGCDHWFLLALLCSFISSILRLLPRSDLQYSCMTSKSSFTIFGMHLSKYSPQGPSVSPLMAASIMLCAGTSSAFTRSLMKRWRYSCWASLSPCLMSWKSHEVNSSGFMDRKLVDSSDCSWLHE